MLLVRFDMAVLEDAGVDDGLESALIERRAEGSSS
jgi:hypothetical protein